MPAGARIQVGSPDKHLTIVDRDGISGLKKKNYEYDFYQVQPDTIPGNNGGSITAFSEGALSLDGLGQAETIGSITGNTNAAGFGNLAGRIRIEELKAGKIDHALTIAVPCTKESYAWPANHYAVPDVCKQIGINASWPQMGQLFWLDMDEAQLNSDPATKDAPSWVKTILRAMHNHGMYVNDNGGYQSAYFQLQTEAQVQYSSLGAGDPWYDFGKANWDRSGVEPAYVGALQGHPPSGTSQDVWIKNWQAVWKRLRVIDPCFIPRPTPCIN
jgi:hypothetical protein